MEKAFRNQESAQTQGWKDTRMDPHIHTLRAKMRHTAFSLNYCPRAVAKLEDGAVIPYSCGHTRRAYKYELAKK